MKSKFIIPLLLLSVIATAGCSSNQQNITGNISVLKLTSSAFQDGGAIPAKYTAGGDNVSPPLYWGSAPADTKSFAIICQDRDSSSGDFTHWIIYNIPSNTTQLSESIPPEGSLPNGAEQGMNDFGKIGYSGPDPPSGTHHYVFTVYALNTMLDLNPGISKSEFLNTIKEHVLAQGKLTGTYSK